MFGGKKHSVNTVFVILLLCVFALAAVFVAMLGAKVYANSAEKLSANYDMRTSIVYLSEKIRACSENAPAVRELDGRDAIVLTEAIEGDTYETWIYLYEGELCETVVPAGDMPFASGGQRIMPLDGLSADIVPGGIELSVVTADGKERSTFIAERSGV